MFRWLSCIIAINIKRHIIFNCIMTSIETVCASDDNSVPSPDDDIQDHKPIKSGGVFDNPWNTWQFPRLDRVLQWKLTSTNRSSIPSKSELDKHLPVVTPDFSQQESHPNDVSVTWLGHATVLVRIDGINILTDPVFSERCSPYNYIGPKRFRKSPCSVEDLPNIDAVLISHNHFDHLDTNSVMSLNKRFGAKLHWFVPSGLASWMHETGTENVTELSWWEKDSPVDLQGITFIFTPAQHWCRRGLFDTNKVLWGSWAVKGPKHSFFFAGDTGYCPVFEVIGRRYGPFDIAAIPIGCYEPSWFMKYQHIDPEEAVKIHQEIKARHSVAIHWGTFALAHEFYLDPPKKLEEALQKRKMTEEDFFTLKHGETKVIPEVVNEDVGDDNKNKSNL